MVTFRWDRMSLEEEVDQQPLDGCSVVADPVIAVGCRGHVLEPVQGALAGEQAHPLRLARSMPASIARAGSRRR
jgi:hypothetical protein